MTTEELWNTPVTLEGKVVRLEPLSAAHIPGLAVAGKDESIWKYMLYGNLTSLESMQTWVDELLNFQAAGTDLPFTVIHKKSGNDRRGDALSWKCAPSPFFGNWRDLVCA